MLVVDASALVKAVTEGSGPESGALDRMEGRRLHAPHLVDAELGSALRRMVLRRQLTAEVAAAARRLGEALIDTRHPHAGPLSEAAWQLRDTVGFYDGLYVALAAALDCEMLTADHRLARAAVPGTRVSVI
ncbi:MAG: type II toxin-antitoxin system VapC family toxin [bacterium]|nr:type II toxin-antitoxin system VapC family toxin [bacterium]MDE0667860.1 type II toxin-antitoxin system VapC family toxin [bacterium]